MQAQVPGDQHQPLGLQGRRLLGGAEAAGEHRVEHRQRDADGPRTKKRAAAERGTRIVSESHNRLSGKRIILRVQSSGPNPAA